MTLIEFHLQVIFLKRKFKGGTWEPYFFTMDADNLDKIAKVRENTGNSGIFWSEIFVRNIDLFFRNLRVRKLR